MTSEKAQNHAHLMRYRYLWQSLREFMTSPNILTRSSIQDAWDHCRDHDPREGFIAEPPQPTCATIVQAAIDFVVGQGPCDDAENGDGYCDCQVPSCTYCTLARALAGLDAVPAHAEAAEAPKWRYDVVFGATQIPLPPEGHGWELLSTSYCVDCAEKKWIHTWRQQR